MLGAVLQLLIRDAASGAPRGKLSLVDLAGAEKASETQVSALH